jgi:hypothetical protein
MNRLAAVIFFVGVEYAYLLFSTIHTNGHCWTAAKFNPSWKAPVLVASDAGGWSLDARREAPRARLATA